MAVDLSSPGGLQAALGFEGQIATAVHSTIRSRVNNGETAIPFGRAVAKGATSKTCAILANNTDVIVGISVMRPLHPLAAGVVAFKQYDDVPLLNEGEIYAKASETVVDGDGVIALVAGGGTFGSARVGKASTTGRLTVPNAFWVGDVVSGQIGKIAVNTGATIYSST
jgi:hypothetical protein